MKKQFAAATIATALAAGCSTHGAGSNVAVPETLKPAPGETLALETHATGVQIYECGAAKEQPARFAWVFKAPEAELFDRSGNKVGKHYGGPTWESNDGSKVVAGVKARSDAPAANAVPWLLLGAKSNAGAGVFGKTTSIQRVNTVGGAAPAGGCGNADAGKVARVPYEATYYFYVQR